VEGRGHRNTGTFEGKDDGDIGLHNRINETRADSKAGARDTAGGIDNARPSHRHRLAARGVSAHAQGRSHRRGPAGAINLWWPLIGPVRDTPLAVCDARTIEAADLVRTEQGVKHEVYLLNFNPNHRWFYFPAMTTSEMLLFKCFDSRTGSGARMTAHSAFDLPGGGGTPSRQSIEVRALVFFAR
jgi:hypothetical protein